MPDPALLDPNNRLLGWSTNDFSLYGGQPTVTLGAPRAAEAGNSFVSVPSVLRDGDRTSDGAGGTPANLAAPSIADSPSGGSGVAPTSFLSTSPGPAAIPPAPAQADSPAVPDPTGSGSLAPISVATPLSARAAEGTGDGGTPFDASPFAAPVLDIAPPAAALDGIAAAALNPAIVAPILATVTGAFATAGDLVEQAGGLVAATGATAGGSLADTGAMVDGLLDGLTSALPVAGVAATLAPVAGTAATDALTGTIDAATQALGDATGGVADVADDTLVATTPSLDAAAGSVASIGDGATLALDADDGILAGANPAGGVATLVGMVEASEMFDLSQAGQGLAPVTEGGSILDALAADEAPGALLGIAGDDGDGGLLGDHHHDDSDGGLLGGL